MPKPILILQLRPEDRTADDEFASILRYGGLSESEVLRRRVESTGLDGINLNDVSAIIVGGSPFDVSTPAPQKSTQQVAIENAFFQLFDEVVRRDFPLLGCCSGNGLLGSYCGANISTRYGEAVGGVDIELTDAGRQDPLLIGLPARFRVLVGHKEACDTLPPGCVLLARGESCPVQMFRLGSNIYATQFHPEGDARGFTVRIETYRHHGYFPPDTADALIERIASEHTPHAHGILSRFVTKYRL